MLILQCKSLLVLLVHSCCQVIKMETFINDEYNEYLFDIKCICKRLNSTHHFYICFLRRYLKTTNNIMNICLVSSELGAPDWLWWWCHKYSWLERLERIESWWAVQGLTQETHKQCDADYILNNWAPCCKTGILYTIRMPLEFLF